MDAAMERMNVYFNHDAGIDDLVSLFLLLQMDQVKVTGVSVIPADGYLTPGVEASRKIIDRFGRETVEVARSNSRGHNPFPKEWRMHPFFVDALPILNESGKVEAPLSKLPAHEHLIQQVRENEGQTTLLCTGPLTDVARALDADPGIEEKIERLIWMGGTLNAVGNVQEPEHDGTAEWNAFWDPEAVARVWQSRIPVRMVALESTNQVPLTVPIRNQWASLRKYSGIDFLGQCYAAVPPLVHFETNSTYYLWDVLTTMAAGNPELVRAKKVRTLVHTEEPSQGRIEESEDGREVEIVYDVKADAFFESIVSLAKKARQ
ncbi:ABC transporter substrate-binding protein [Sporolactobacillus terrae]|uniref:ABC transporter substrate-binding protein n=2 Tax=Sporolactobacillus terrae TaxID=269673 RepID=A0ABX5QAW8_9BACL|nr:nucleoside hydrolase [Sporolactobacillus terrae]QAA23783.1 ABC transporter substrate-binding protein [Sporolactobacillus terrae]QAA26754.1 ABC transporter substrate-binding protein [Sporolactobacillus terrae]